MIASSSPSGAIGIQKIHELTELKIKKIQKTIGQLDQKTKAYDEIETKVKDLYHSLKHLDNINLDRKLDIIPSGSIKATAQAAAAVGSYHIHVQNLATASQLSGYASCSAALYGTLVDIHSLDEGPLLSALPSLKEGWATINNQRIEILFSDTLQDVFQKVNAATRGDLEINYDPHTDKMTLTSLSGQPILVGSAQDTSNFWQVMQLPSKSQSTPSTAGPLSTISEMSLGRVQLTVPMAESGLKHQNLFDSTSHTLHINGYAIPYDPQIDSISTIMQHIQNSGCGVQLTYNPIQDQFALINEKMGAIGMQVEDTGRLIEVLGLQDWLDCVLEKILIFRSMGITC